MIDNDIFDIFVEKKSFWNWPKKLRLKEYPVGYVIVECTFTYPFGPITRLNEREMFLTARASDSVVLLRKYGVIAT